jgi:peptidoglycan/LPS O-acetylase OafA/YrhL
MTSPIEANLNILRSAAVLSVLACHIIPIFRPHRILFGMDAWEIGRAGVLIFFVHTSLVLMLSLERMGTAHLRRRFYIRRAFRIYPLSILVCIVVSVAAIPRDFSGTVFEWSWPQFASNVLLIQNLTGQQNLTNPLWSLPYEVQMYLALPFVFVFLRARRWPIRAIALFVAGIVAAHADRALFEFVPCFLLGVLVYKALPLIRLTIAWNRRPWRKGGHCAR